MGKAHANAHWWHVTQNALFYCPHATRCPRPCLPTRLAPRSTPRAPSTTATSPCPAHPRLEIAREGRTTSALTTSQLLLVQYEGLASWLCPSQPPLEEV